VHSQQGSRRQRKQLPFIHTNRTTANDAGGTGTAVADKPRDAQLLKKIRLCNSANMTIVKQWSVYWVP